MIHRIRNIEWDLLQRQLLLALMAILASAALLYITYDYTSQYGKKYAQERRQLRQVMAKYKAALTDEALYKQYVTDFQKYQDRQVLGDENRLQWIETLQKINTDLRLPVLKYDIKPRQTFSLDNLVESRDNRLIPYESVMRLTLGLLHEGDLFEIFRRLKDADIGIFEIRACSIKRNTHEDDIRYGGNTPNLNADCFISWYTIKLESEYAAKRR